jgi:hypothetical protein
VIRTTVLSSDDMDNDACDAHTCVAKSRLFELGSEICVEYSITEERTLVYHGECYSIPRCEEDDDAVIAQLRDMVAAHTETIESMRRRIDMDGTELRARQRLLDLKYQEVFGILDKDMTPQEYTMAVNAGKSFVLNQRAQADAVITAEPRQYDVDA